MGNTESPICSSHLNEVLNTCKTVAYLSLAFPPIAASSSLIFQGLQQVSHEVEESTSDFLLGTESLPLKEIQFHLDNSLRGALRGTDN